MTFPLNKQSDCVVIIGMHRSGTSCLAGSLQQCGLYLGKVFEKNEHNKKGNRENASIMNLNDKVLSFNKGSWINPPKNIIWNSSLQIERDEIINEFLAQNKKLWGFKDPRTLFTLPFWTDRINNINLVGTFRNPMSVAKSLLARNGIEIVLGLGLWKKYNEKLLVLHEKYRFPLVSFDVSSEIYAKQINKISLALGLKEQEINFDKLFFDESLRNHNSPIRKEFINSDIKSIYYKLQSIYENQQ